MFAIYHNDNDKLLDFAFDEETIGNLCSEYSAAIDDEIVRIDYNAPQDASHVMLHILTHQVSVFRNVNTHNQVEFVKGLGDIGVLINGLITFNAPLDQLRKCAWDDAVFYLGPMAFRSVDEWELVE